MVPPARSFERETGSATRLDSWRIEAQIGTNSER
jgi:hypothetical protein